MRLDYDYDAGHTQLGVLSRAEQERADCFVLDRDRRRFVAARACLRRLLAVRLGVRPEAVELTAGPYGKPELAQSLAGSNLRFNVSHCEDLAVFAFAVGRQIGIDVEMVRVISDELDIAARFFSRSEFASYLQLNPRDRTLGFFNCWTRKEAFIKARGVGLGCDLDGFDVSLAPHEPAKILSVSNTADDRCGWDLYSFVPVPGSVGAVVLQNVAGAPHTD